MQPIVNVPRRATPRTTRTTLVAAAKSSVGGGGIALSLSLSLVLVLAREEFCRSHEKIVAFTKVRSFI